MNERITDPADAMTVDRAQRLCTSGEALDAVRTLRRSQRALAREMGAHESHLSTWLHARRPLPRNVIGLRAARAILVLVELATQERKRIAAAHRQLADALDPR